MTTQNVRKKGLARIIVISLLAIILALCSAPHLAYAEESSSQETKYDRVIQNADSSSAIELDTSVKPTVQLDADSQENNALLFEVLPMDHSVALMLMFAVAYLFLTIAALLLIYFFTGVWDTEPDNSRSKTVLH